LLDLESSAQWQKPDLYPFSQEREGLVLGEGAAVLVIESLAAAQKRDRAQIYGEILSFGMSNDASHPTSPDRHHIVKPSRQSTPV
jgi:3-oxoacyl-[acyl-carrier-protein] synthase II